MAAAAAKEPGKNCADALLEPSVLTLVFLLCRMVDPPEARTLLADSLQLSTSHSVLDLSRGVFGCADLHALVEPEARVAWCQD